MDKVVFKGAPRTEFGTRSSRRERAQGRIPAVIYGREGTEPVHFTLDTMDVAKMLRGQTKVLEVDIEGGRREAGLVREIQMDAITDEVLHLDMVHVDLTQKVEVGVQIEFMGHPKGLAAGGKFTHDLSDLPVTCLPSVIPSRLSVKVAHLEVGQQLFANEVELPEGVELAVPGDTLVCHVKAFLDTGAEGGEEEGDESPAEPEIIGRKSEDEGE